MLTPITSLTPLRIAVCAAALACAPLDAQAPPLPTGTASIAGQAVDAVNGEPVANTLIGLSMRVASGPNTTPSRVQVPLVQVLSDAQGRFAFRDVPKGPYLILATAPGYIVSTHGQARPSGPTHTVDIGDGEHLSGYTIKLWRHAAIAGTVTDEAGEPVVGATVRVLRRAPNAAGGLARYSAGIQTTTDDRGEYRLTQLVPGEFLVAVPQTQITIPASVVDGYLRWKAGEDRTSAAELLDLMASSSVVPTAGGGVRIGDLLVQSSGNGKLMTSPPASPNGPLLVYPTTMLGGDLPGSVTRVSVGPGEERTGLNIHLIPEKTVRVSGMVMADGAPAANVPVRLVRADAPAMSNDSDFEAAATISNADGTFALMGVTTGSYVLKAARTAKLTLPAALAANPAIPAAYGGADVANGSAPIGAQLPVTIGADDLTNLSVILRAGAMISGTIVTDAGATPFTEKQMQSFAILLMSEDGGVPGSGALTARVSGPGDFSVTAPAPGSYRVAVLGPPAAGWTLSGSTLHGQPLTGPIDLSKDKVSELLIAFTDKTSQVSGVVHPATPGASVSANVVVFPAGRSGWTPDPLNPRSPKIEQAAASGLYTVGGLLPGDYLVAAIDESAVPEIIDAAFLDAVSMFATRVTVGVSERRTQDLSIGRIK
jgi:hypothetical protein